MSANLILRILTGGAGDTTKSAALTNAEMDQNLINLDNEIDLKATTAYVNTKTVDEAMSMAIALG